MIQISEENSEEIEVIGHSNIGNYLKGYLSEIGAMLFSLFDMVGW